jgi:siroheme synthase-like protein
LPFMTNTTPQEQNELFPVFLKLKQLRLLIIGGGYVGMEKLEAVISNSPQAIITLVAVKISEEIKELAASYPGITLKEKPYHISDFDDIDIAIAAINDPVISGQVAADAKNKGILVNAADKPDLCDFYLGSVVQKGNLKIAISTNGKSPTIAKRLKEVLNDALPEEIDDLLNSMQQIRNKMSGDFTQKVRQLNELTKTLSQNQ